MKMVEEELKKELREGIRAAGITLPGIEVHGEDGGGGVEDGCEGGNQGSWHHNF